MATSTPTATDGVTPPAAKLAEISTGKAGYANAPGGAQVSPTGTAQRASSNRTVRGQFAGPGFMRRHPSARGY